MRVKRGKWHSKHRRHLLKDAKGYLWGRKSKIKMAKMAVTKAGVYAYRDRRTKKREFRKLWQVQINAGVRPLGLNYSQFINRLKTNKIILDRKILSNLAEAEPEIFEEIVKKVK